jgi:hypothetical protein
LLIGQRRMGRRFCAAVAGRIMKVTAGTGGCPVGVGWSGLSAAGAGIIGNGLPTCFRRSRRPRGHRSRHRRPPPHSGHADPLRAAVNPSALNEHGLEPGGSPAQASRPALPGRQPQSPRRKSHWDILPDRRDRVKAARAIARIARAGLKRRDDWRAGKPEITGG